MNPRNSYSGISSSLIAIVSKKARELCHHKYFIADDFEDLQQELIVDLYFKIKDCELSEPSMRALAKTIVENKAKKLIRKASRKKRGGEVSIYSLHDSIGDDEDYLLIDTIPADSTFYDYEAAESCDAMEFELDIEKVINRLPPDLQELYELLQTMTITEISKIKCKSRTTIYEELKTLKKEISQMFIDSEFKK